MTIDFLKIRRSPPHADEGGQTLENNTVTVRNRDTTKQERVKVEDHISKL